MSCGHGSLLYSRGGRRPPGTPPSSCPPKRPRRRWAGEGRALRGERLDGAVNGWPWPSSATWRIFRRAHPPPGVTFLSNTCDGSGRRHRGLSRHTPGPLPHVVCLGSVPATFLDGDMGARASIVWGVDRFPAPFQAILQFFHLVGAAETGLADSTSAFQRGSASERGSRTGGGGVAVRHAPAFRVDWRRVDQRRGLHPGNAPGVSAEPPREGEFRSRCFDFAAAIRITGRGFAGYTGMEPPPGGYFHSEENAGKVVEAV